MKELIQGAYDLHVHRHTADHAVKCCRDEIQKRAMQCQWRISHLYKAFFVCFYRFVQMVKIFRNGKFDAFHSKFAAF